MTGAARPLPKLLLERGSLVAEMARLNSEQLRHRQMVGGCAIELMLRERELEAGGDPVTLQQAVDEAAARQRDAEAAFADCERRRQALEERFEQLDREIAAA